MSDVHALSGAYAVDALDQIERARFARHLAECEACSQEVESFREAAALLASTIPVEPSAELRERVLAGINQVRPLPPLVIAATNKAGQVRRPHGWFPAVVAAAAVVIAGVIGSLTWHPLSGDAEISTESRVLDAADAQSWTRKSADGSVTTLTRSRELNRAVLQTSDLPLPPAGMVYEVWLRHGSQLVPAGLIPPDPDGTLLLSGNAANADGAGITIEPEGGSQTPSDRYVQAFDFDEA